MHCKNFQDALSSLSYCILMESYEERKSTWGNKKKSKTGEVLEFLGRRFEFKFLSRL